MHPALLGPHAELFDAMGESVQPSCNPLEDPLAVELGALCAEDFDLLAWLVCSHHGKVRCAWASTPKDQEAGHGGIHGIVTGERLPRFVLPDGTGAQHEVPPLELSLSAAAIGIGARYGASWSERVAGLLERHGPFTLAFLECTLRAADWRASGLETEDAIV
jgi:CRISPR-associated endonuclease/helicase Cas3